jgi:hypothetical protein
MTVDIFCILKKQIARNGPRSLAPPWDELAKARRMLQGASPEADASWG